MIWMPKAIKIFGQKIIKMKEAVVDPYECTLDGLIVLMIVSFDLNIQGTLRELF